jgi:hypothetical protein
MQIFTCIALELMLAVTGWVMFLRMPAYGRVSLKIQVFYSYSSFYGVFVVE